MLEFDTEHQSMNGSLKEKKGLKVRNIIIGGMMLASVLLFSGCVKNVDCNINEYHAHYYVNEDSFDKFIIGEKESVGKWEHTDEHIVINKSSEKLIDFENKNNLFRISYNQDKINEIVSSKDTNHTEYRYKYRWVQFIPVKVGKVTINNQIWHTGYSWTTNSEHNNLTGEQRIVSRMYYGYKVVEDEQGHLQLVQSEMVDNLGDLPEDFIYIKPKFYKTVYLDNKNLEVDYEDGPEEQKPNFDKQKDYNDPEPLEQENPISKIR